MKVKCEFCKTEYNLDKLPATQVRCALCGHSWAPTMPPRKNMWLIFIASLCALLSAIVFTIAVITQHHAKNANRGPLIVGIENIETMTDENGKPHIVVNGNVSNVSEYPYAVPDLIIVSSDDDGNVLAQQRFMPSAAILDSGKSVKFTHVLGGQPTGVKKISAKLADLEVLQKDK